MANNSYKCPESRELDFGHFQNYVLCVQHFKRKVVAIPKLQKEFPKGLQKELRKRCEKGIEKEREQVLEKDME